MVFTGPRFREFILDLNKNTGTLGLLFDGFGKVEVYLVFLEPFLLLLLGLLLDRGSDYSPVKFLIVFNELIILTVKLIRAHTEGLFQVLETVCCNLGVFLNDVLLFVVLEQFVQIFFVFRH